MYARLAVWGVQCTIAWRSGVCWDHMQQGLDSLLTLPCMLPEYAASNGTANTSNVTATSEHFPKI